MENNLMEMGEENLYVAISLSLKHSYPLSNTLRHLLSPLSNNIFYVILMASSEIEEIGGGAPTAPAGGVATGGVPPGGVLTVPAGGVATEGVPAGGVLTVPAAGAATGGIPIVPDAEQVTPPTVQAGGVPTAPAGGAATGGVPAGGVATGGVPAGGFATGGVPAGGFATGGVPAGGVATGGVPAGGAATGGVPAEGVPTAPIVAEERGLVDGSESRLKVNRRALGSFLVVVTLFTCVTVGAAFAVPVEDFVSDPDIGRWKHIVAATFFSSDMLAICTSVIAVIFLTLGHLGDDRLVAAALELSAALIPVTLMLMTLSFAAGIAIVGRSVPFAVGTLGLCIFLAIMFPLFVRRVRWSHSLAVFMVYWIRMVSR
ncbi:hypothetical protein SASPL_151285 [Salvia splendens]|uniref:PGG domain-containing protein n=1 Tax=Salvia splendens TaxID=180675 RepID=A0A8X8W8C1_SALSN|nr:uncharacterized protein LOC121781910 [Salvia splendens]KAG6389811.1 hypothetical protein SASPL_151285 [Salvia splendens]